MAAPSPADVAPAKPGWRLRWPRSRWRRRVLALFVVLLVAFCGLTAELFVFPATGMPGKVDAIVVPGGPGNRLAAGLALARQNRARYLVLSQGQYVPPQLCGSRVGTASVICFQPDPATTQGEAEATAHLAREYGFRSIVLVTTPDQTWRAKLRLQRCYGGEISAVTTPLPLHLWPYQIAYQWAAAAKAEVFNRGC
jgi:uncharacterized SAM-binding protein YcdF (DUF218 family)